MFALRPQASRQFDQEGRKKFFTLDMNDILLEWVWDLRLLNPTSSFYPTVGAVSASFWFWHRDFLPALSCRSRSSLLRCARSSTRTWRRLCRATRRPCSSGWRSSASTSRWASADKAANPSDNADGEADHAAVQQFSIHSEALKKKKTPVVSCWMEWKCWEKTDSAEVWKEKNM